MALEVEGKIVRKLNVQSGVSQRGNWSKQEFILEYQEGSYPSQACFSVWGEDKVKDLDRFKIGDTAKVSFNISSREYNGRWYTDLRAWRIEAVSTQDQPAAATVQTPAQPAQSPAAAGSVPAEDNQEDDLPF
ncbi:MAG: DUF3127 domain-containing protein [Bacteroidetes bacterium]|uniref:DUF3127 domain-containing protein n=1 Tax=Candidatus Cryptobacteroides intestinigallinarum TaxID=2840767 RepID=A0A9D9HMF0_9BACT|nr:DUF3127 domain-containing protein [Candidatus Cryptobacteroides intestinigallinarum]